MIHLYGNYGRLRQACLLFQKMGEFWGVPDTWTYNILISLNIKNNKVKLATKYFARMKEAFLEADVVSYLTLLYAYSTRKMVREAEELIREMGKRDLEIDEFTQFALTRMYVESGMLEQSWLWFRRFHLAGNINSDCYYANIDAYGKRGYTLAAEKVFICCKEKKKLTVLEFNVMIKAYGIGKCYDKACQLFDSMKKFGVVADKCSYSSLIHILASADKPHIAKSYLKKMQEAGLVSDCVPYCVMISSFTKLGQFEMEEELYKEMLRYVVQPDVIIYGVFINAFADAGSVKEAINYVNEMRKSGLPGNPAIYNSLIKLYTKDSGMGTSFDFYYEYPSRSVMGIGLLKPLWNYMNCFLLFFFISRTKPIFRTTMYYMDSLNLTVVDHIHLAKSKLYIFFPIKTWRKSYLLLADLMESHTKLSEKYNCIRI
ncbi:pentatricopeptide repeat-containing protein At3g23020-like [Glycine max]|uniref:pentatricopeptide repeat-containing protein At3g23020-like n=1 Tax=Glycine max TaxID=3847 RepID=UPI001B3574E7|nr:pentatricopeptide repeat-containing protein At3g23020-like [Glycine max]